MFLFVLYKKNGGGNSGTSCRVHLYGETGWLAMVADWLAVYSVFFSRWIVSTPVFYRRIWTSVYLPNDHIRFQIMVLMVSILVFSARSCLGFLMDHPFLGEKGLVPHLESRIPEIGIWRCYLEWCSRYVSICDCKKRGILQTGPRLHVNTVMAIFARNPSSGDSLGDC